MPTADPNQPPPVPSGGRPALHVESVGDGPPLVMAHGFTQTGRVWGTLDTDLARDHRLVLVDLPGHGGSSAVTTSLGEGAALLAETGGVAAYLGYSMGARYCVRLALDHPEVVERLVLISGTAGIDTDADRHLRRRSDEALADRLDPPPGSATEAQPVADFVRAWLEAPLFAGIGEDAAGIDRRAANTGVGLASSLRLAGTGTQEPLWDRLGDLSMPVLVVTGARDGKFTALGRRMVDAIGPNSRQVVVDGAGHAPHLQYPAEVAALVRSFLAEPVAD